MEQLSRPYQIALGAILLLAVAWFLALKPKDAVSEPATAPPGVTGLGNAVEKAEGASAASDASAAATASAAAAASGEAPAGSTPSAAVAPAGASTRAPASMSPAAAADAAAAAKDPSRKVLRWLDRGKVAVVTFYARGAADDKAVRRTLRRLNRRGGEVRVFAADIAKIGSYEAITRGVPVLQAPTTLVISPDRRARKLVGYFDRAEIQQRVDDVVRAAGIELSSAVRKQLRKAARRLCGAGAERKACRTHLEQANKACATGRAAATDLAVTVEKLTALKPPAPLAAAHGQLLAALRAEQAGTPGDPAASRKLRAAGHAACVSAA